MERPDDDLRARWQRATHAAAPPPLAPAAVTALLAQRSQGIGARLRRTARLELGGLVLALIGLPILLYQTQSRVLQLAEALLLVVCLGFCYYYARKLRLLRLMDEAAAGGDVRAHLQTLVGALRRLLRLYERQVVLLTPVFLLIGLIAGAVEGAPAGATRLLSWHAWPLYVGYGVLAVPLTLLQRWGVRWYLRQLYGRHLDQLESDLRELEEN